MSSLNSNDLDLQRKESNCSDNIQDSNHSFKNIKKIHKNSNQSKIIIIFNNYIKYLIR